MVAPTTSVPILAIQIHLAILQRQYPELLEEGLQPHKVKEILLWGSEDSNYRLDITSTFDLKVAALLCHKSQVGDRLFPELQKRRRERAEMMAQGEDFKLAEAFHRIEILR